MDFSEFLKDKQNRIDRFILNFLENLPFQDTLLLGAIKYGVFSGGKRIRPVLMYILGEIFKIHISITDHLASSIEFMHSYSLIHDDLPALDHDEFRRNKLSCYKKFGESTAILAGNALQCLSFNILARLHLKEISDSKKVNMILNLSNSSGILGMCAGQFFDLEFKRKSVTLNELERMYWHKTGSLIDVAVRFMLTFCCQENDKIFSTFLQYSKNISFALQLRDDIIDFKNDKTRIDFYRRSGENCVGNTFPLILGLHKSKEKLKELYKNALLCLKTLSDEYIDVKLLAELAHYVIIFDK